MKRRTLSVLFGIGIFASVAIAAETPEKSITIDDAMSVLKEYYDADFFDKEFWLLAERTEQWEIFVDEMPHFANWAHDCTIYKFPNTGDPAIDLVPEIIKPNPAMPPNEEMEPIAVITGFTYVGYGELEERMQHIWNTTHALSIGESQLNEADFQALNNCVTLGRLGQIHLYNVELENDAIPNGAFICNTTVGTDTNKLQRIILPEGVVTIGASAFNGCDFEEFTFPASVRALGQESCYNWQNIKWIYSEAITPPECQNGDSFGGLTPKTTPIYVPIGAAEAYRAAPGWDYFTTFIETDKAPSADIEEITLPTEANVYYENGSIVIESQSEPVAYSIYSIDGKLVSRGVVASRTTCISCPKGFYVVTVGDEVHKVR